MNLKFVQRLAIGQRRKKLAQVLHVTGPHCKWAISVAFATLLLWPLVGSALRVVASRRNTSALCSTCKYTWHKSADAKAERKVLHKCLADAICFRKEDDSISYFNLACKRCRAKVSWPHLWCTLLRWLKNQSGLRCFIIKGLGGQRRLSTQRRHSTSATYLWSHLARLG